MILVLDTNVFISALFWKGPPHEILKLAEHGAFTIASSPPLLEELSGVLARKKFQRYLLATGTNLEAIRERIAELVELYPIKSHAVFVITEDPSDNMFLACALSSNAEYIISGDDHLLSLGSFKDVSIVTPQQFLQRFGK